MMAVGVATRMTVRMNLHCYVFSSEHWREGSHLWQEGFWFRGFLPSRRLRCRQSDRSAPGFAIAKWRASSKAAAGFSTTWRRRSCVSEESWDVWNFLQVTGRAGERGRSASNVTAVMDAGEVTGWDLVVILFTLSYMLYGLNIHQRNAPYRMIYPAIPGVGVYEVYDEPAAPPAAAADVEPEAGAPAGGEPVSSELSITTQQARDMGIVLAPVRRPGVVLRALDDDEAAPDYDNSSDEEDDHMSTTTLQPRATPETPRIEAPGDVHVDALNNPSNIKVEADDASSMLQQEVGRAVGTGPHIAKPAFIIATPVTAATSNVLVVTSTRLGTSLDPVRAQESSTTSITREKKQVISSESSSSVTDSTT